MIDDAIESSHAVIGITSDVNRIIWSVNATIPSTTYMSTRPIHTIRAVIGMSHRVMHTWRPSHNTRLSSIDSSHHDIAMSVSMIGMSDPTIQTSWPVTRFIHQPIHMGNPMMSRRTPNISSGMAQRLICRTTILISHAKIVIKTDTAPRCPARSQLYLRDPKFLCSACDRNPVARDATP